MSAERAQGRWGKRPPRVLGIPGTTTTMTETTIHDTTIHDTTIHDTTIHDTTIHDTTIHDTTIHDTTIHDTTIHDTTIHDFRARNGWHATMTRHGRSRQPQYEARIYDT